jgi:hypothetical protein
MAMIPYCCSVVPRLLLRCSSVPLRNFRIFNCSELWISKDSNLWEQHGQTIRSLSVQEFPLFWTSWLTLPNLQSISFRQKSLTSLILKLYAKRIQLAPSRLNWNFGRHLWLALISGMRIDQYRISTIWPTRDVKWSLHLFPSGLASTS